MPKVLVIGFATRDTTLVTHEIPPVEGDADVESRVTLGGSATNTALGLASIGGPLVRLNYPVGDDEVGDWVVDELDTAYVYSDPMEDATGTKSIWTISDGDARYLVENEGVDIGDDVHRIDHRWDMFDNYDIDHVHATTSHPDLVDGLAEKLVELNAGDRPTCSVEITQTYEPWAYTELIRAADLLRCNATEFANLDAEFQGITEIVEDVVVTHGDEGATWWGDYGTRVNEVGMPADDIDVVDTTGAGDAFTAGLLWALFDGADRTTALRVGNRCGADAVQQVGPCHELGESSAQTMVAPNE